MFDPSQAYHIVSVGCGKLLDAHHPRGLRLLDDGGGAEVGSAVAGRASARWKLLLCPHEQDALYIVNEGHQAFLDTHGTDLGVWNNHGKDIPTIIAGNVSAKAGNIRWRVLRCPHQPGVYYLVNVRHGTFLDADGGDLAFWNRDGKDAAQVIAANTSRWAANIRWLVLPVEHRGHPSSPSRAAALVPQPRPPVREVRILHLSDTHNLHRSAESRVQMPEADIILHTGDFSENGSDAEIADIDAWFGEVAERYPHRIVIPGNHDWWGTLHQVEAGRLSPQQAAHSQYMQSKFRNARVLCHEEVVILGLRIFGSSWCPWQKAGSPDQLGRSTAHRDTLEAWLGAGGCQEVFGQMPKGLDVLMTHGPADQLLDCTGTPGRGWGSSKKLREAIVQTKPRMHLFGHLHEQRGQYRRGPAGYEGGVEYLYHGKPFPTTGPPPHDYPCELISCNAMCNHRGIDGTGVDSLAGPPRLICITPR